MKHPALLFFLFYSAFTIKAQKYPDPEFSNEIYFLKKDSIHSLVRLEKDISSMNTKMKLGGFGGGESGYTLKGEKSKVRLPDGENLSFVFSAGTSSGSSSAQSDSVLRANGLDPSIMSEMNDPASRITLYYTESGKGLRKIVTQKTPGAMGFGAKKMFSGSEKYTFSMKKIKEGYWELVIDKTLPKGEYAFAMMNNGINTGDMSMLLFAFGID